MEVEVRYYFSLSEEEKLVNYLKKISELKYCGNLYEKTEQFNHPMEEYNFYSKSIDGRFRVRISKGEEVSKCMISWKRRLNQVGENDINKEEEVEVSINPLDYDNLIFLINNVLHLKLVESYERYRHIFKNDEVEIAVDIYPFGIALEIESKTTNNSEQVILKWLDKLDLKLSDSYKLSWDDKYTSLCKKQGTKPTDIVEFGKEMPKVENSIFKINKDI